MTAYSLLHVIIATACAFLAIVHFVIFRIVPRDTVQRAVALSFAGFTMVNLGIAGSGMRALGSLGPSAPWLVLGILAVLPLWSGLLLTAWDMVGAPLTPGRRALLLAAVVFAVIRLADVAILLYARGWPHTPLAWEEVMNTSVSITTLPAWGMTIVVGATCVAEAMSDFGRESPASWVLAGTALPATALCVREMLLTLGWVSGPTWLGFTGLPFLCTASGIVALRYISAVREQNQAGEVSGYKLLKKLDAGGMGELFLAARVGPAGFERHVALKRMIIEDDDTAAERRQLAERFLAEARMAAGLVHPNIVAVHDVGRLDGGWFIAMEYLNGVTLAQVRDRAREGGLALPLGFVFGVGAQIAHGLAYAHEQRIVHRDVSPQNVMLTFDGLVKIIDFGIAVELEQDGSTPRVPAFGKNPYLSPERVAGASGDAASDVFALGIVLYEMLCGQRPFRGADKADLLRSIVSVSYVPIDDLRPDTPPEVIAAIDNALARRPIDRAGAKELALVLDFAAARQPTPIGGVVRDLCSAELKELRRTELYAGVHGSREVDTRRLA